MNEKWPGLGPVMRRREDVDRKKIYTTKYYSSSIGTKFIEKKTLELPKRRTRPGDVYIAK